MHVAGYGSTAKSCIKPCTGRALQLHLVRGFASALFHLMFSLAQALVLGPIERHRQLVIRQW